MKEQEKKEKKLIKTTLTILLLFLCYGLIVGTAAFTCIIFMGRIPAFIELLMYFGNVGAVGCGVYTISQGKGILMKLLGIFIIGINLYHVLAYLIN